MNKTLNSAGSHSVSLEEPFIASEISGDRRCQLGEGLLVSKGLIAWLDIDRDELFIQTDREYTSYGLPVKGTAVVDLVGEELRIISSRGLGSFSLTTRRYSTICNWPMDICGTTHRTNDGCVLANGAYLFGTMDSTASDGETGALYLMDADGSFRELHRGIAIPNLFVELKDGSVLIADSARGKIFRGELDFSSGSITLDFWSQVAGDIAPDGGCLLPDGRIAIAMWDGACIQVFDSTGKLSCELPVPARRPTNVKYKADTDMLVVTSASEGLEAADIERYPLSGMTFTLPFPGAI